MEIDFYIRLLIKKWKGTISDHQNSELSALVDGNTDNQLFVKEMKQAWDAGELYELPFEIDENAAFDKVLQKIELPSSPSIESEKTAKIVSLPRQNYRRWLAIAATFLLVAVIGIWLYNDMIKIPQQTLVSNAEIRQLELSDGTLVWLNKHSKISYPVEFGNKNRVVEIEGEAFFKVTPNPYKPFSIQTAKAKVVVLGTSFNLRAFSQEYGVEVAVQEGRVRLQPTNSQQFIDLIANEVGYYNHPEKKLNRSKSLNLNSIAWQRAKLIFRDTPLRQTLQEIGDFHKIEIIVKNVSMYNCPFTGRYETGQNPEEVLKEIAEVMQMELVKIRENKFQLLNGSCQ